MTATGKTPRTVIVDEAYLAQHTKAPRVTPADIEANIIAEHYFTAFEGRMGSIVEGTYESIGKKAGSDLDITSLKLLTFCVLVLKNGFTVHGVSACADPSNFDRYIGQSIAKSNAIGQIWPLMGYDLKNRLHEGRPIEPEEIDVEEIARVCHEANRSWCELNGDHSQPAWDDAPQWQKDSAMLGVRFHIDNQGAGDSASHECWMAEKIRTGWVYGPVKDTEAKTHPCMVPFEELPEAQQFKDKLFRTIVQASLGWNPPTPTLVAVG